MRSRSDKAGRGTGWRQAGRQAEAGGLPSQKEASVAGNVVFSGGGVGCGVLSILQGESKEGARSSYENRSQHVGCL